MKKNNNRKLKKNEYLKKKSSELQNMKDKVNDLEKTISNNFTKEEFSRKSGE